MSAMNDEEARRRLSRALKAELSRRGGWDYTKLAVKAGVGRESAADAAEGRRWPRPSTRRKIEQALRWPAGTIEAIGNGAEPPSEMDDVQMVSAIPTLSDQERRAILLAIYERLSDADDAALRVVESTLRLLSPEE